MTRDTTNRKVALSIACSIMATHSSTLAWKIPWMEKPVGYSPWGHKELDTTERLHFHTLMGIDRIKREGTLKREKGALLHSIFGQ